MEEFGAFGSVQFAVARGQTGEAFGVFAYVAVDEVGSHRVGHPGDNRAGLAGAYGFHVAALFGHQFIHDGIGREGAVRLHDYFGSGFGGFNALIGAAPGAFRDAGAHGVFVAAV